jgi:TolB-like protein/Tfp pilus assembly protein PilF
VEGATAEWMEGVQSQIGLRRVLRLLQHWTLAAKEEGRVPPISGLIRFVAFEVDLDSGELRKGGTVVPLQGQPFHLLALLLQRPGALVTRDEMRQRLWPDGTFVDFEHGLNAAVKRLRAALGDSADSPRFIETLPRRGYRFIAPVDDVDDVDDDTSLHEATTSAEGGRAMNGALELPGARRPRLAVLPFVDIGADPDDYFSDGLTGEMIAQLGQLCAPRVGVIARTSAMLFRGSRRSAREIGEALRVDYLLEGSVRRHGDRVRIATQLVETRGETQLWAQTYDRDMGDVLAVQSDVAARIAESLAVELTPALRSVHPSVRSPAAHDAYLKGLFYWGKPADSGLPEAIRFFEDAMRLDPSFAAAQGALARMRVAQAVYYAREPRLALEDAREAARRALDLDASESDAHLAIGAVRLWLDWDWAGAESAFRTAITLNPNNHAAHREYGQFLATRGRTLEATVLVDRACALDPLCLAVGTSAAWVRYLGRDYDGALDRVRHTLDKDSRYPPALHALGAILMQTGCTAEAVACFEAAFGEWPTAVAATLLAHALGVSGDRERSAQVVAQLSATGAMTFVSPYHQALAQVGIGNAPAALKLLSEACDVRDPAVIQLASDPRFDPLRRESGYDAVAARLARTL